MQLNAERLKIINKDVVETPDSSLLALPEKVLQFGTGVLLRGLPDFFIDQANKQSVFNGRVVVVKSTDTGGSDSFQKQDGLYTVVVRGYEDGEKINKNIINASISRVLSATHSWEEILACAENPSLQIIISNTTEVGISLVKESIFGNPPASFPAKLLSFLWKRYQFFKGSAEAGMVIIPTELISDNGKQLKCIVLELAAYNQLEQAFIDWLHSANDFCNSLVDRIVPGKLGDLEKLAVETLLGYSDDLMIMCEPYSLWAIETQQERTKNLLSFAKTNKGVKVTANIHQYKELKLRLLNGTHSFSCALAVLSGFETVKEAMEAKYFRSYVASLMLKEIKPLIVSEHITDAAAQKFAEQVMDRFRNNSIEHKWINISMQYSSKMAMRNVPLLLKHYSMHTEAPALMVLGFAAYLLFMRSTLSERGGYETTVSGKNYLITDDKAQLLHQYWQLDNLEVVVKAILSDVSIWGADLSSLPGFQGQIIIAIKNLQEMGSQNILRSLPA